MAFVHSMARWVLRIRHHQLVVMNMVHKVVVVVDID
jgi:hypothetical protein